MLSLVVSLSFECDKFFRRIHKIAKTISFVMSVCLFIQLHGTTWLPLDGFS
jgi:hypothetical protein